MTTTKSEKYSKSSSQACKVHTVTTVNILWSAKEIICMPLSDHLYVCMHACMHACMYVCTYVCLSDSYKIKQK